EGVEGRADVAPLATDRVALDAALRREQSLTRLRVARLVAVLRREDEREHVRELERCEGRSLNALLAHLRAHERQVGPHRGAQLEEGRRARDAGQVRRGAPLAAAADTVALATPLLGVDVPASEQRPVRGERQRRLRRRLLCPGRSE